MKERQVSEIIETLNELAKSIKLSHNTERMIFENELQMQIDKHCLELQLDKEKLKNERLISFYEKNNFRDQNYHLDKNNLSELKFLNQKCLELTTILKKRSNQLIKAREQIRDLKSEKQKLISKLRVKKAKMKEMREEYKAKLQKKEDELKQTKEETEREKQIFNYSEVQVALQEEIKRNRMLTYDNCQLKTQIADLRSVDKYSISTQASILRVSTSYSDEDISG